MHDFAPFAARTKLVALAFVTATLAACGGGAGDEEGPLCDDDPPVPNPVESLVGVYSLPADWNGPDSVEALLSVGAVDECGVARVTLHELDDFDNCYRSTSRGNAAPDGLRGEQVFLSEVFPPFYSAVLDRAGDALSILYFDEDDTDGDGDSAEQRTLVAPNAGITAEGIQSCTPT